MDKKPELKSEEKEATENSQRKTIPYQIYQVNNTVKNSSFTSKSIVYKCETVEDAEKYLDFTYCEVINKFLVKHVKGQSVIQVNRLPFDSSGKLSIGIPSKEFFETREV